MSDLHVNTSDVIMQSEPSQPTPVLTFGEIYSRLQSKDLGGVQIFLGILCLIFNTVFYFYDGIYTTGGYGFMCGLLFILTGSFGVTAGFSATKNTITIFMILCIVSALSTAFLISSGILTALTLTHDRKNDTVTPEFEVHLSMSAALAILGLVELMVSIWGAIICCRVIGCGHHSSGAVEIDRQRLL